MLDLDGGDVEDEGRLWRCLVSWEEIPGASRDVGAHARADSRGHGNRSHLRPSRLRLSLTSSALRA